MYQPISFSDRDFLDAVIEADNERRQRRHEEGIQFTEIQPREEVRYGEELEERKAQDIFSHTSTRDFMEALKPEADENLSSAQSSLELHLLLEDKTINDFIPTRCHSLKHLNLNQRSRLKFQSHNAQRILWQLNQNMSVLWTNWDSWKNITRTSTLVLWQVLQRVPRKEFEFLQISNATSCWTSTLSF